MARGVWEKGGMRRTVTLLHLSRQLGHGASLEGPFTFVCACGATARRRTFRETAPPGSGPDPSQLSSLARTTSAPQCPTSGRPPSSRRVKIISSRVRVVRGTRCTRCGSTTVSRFRYSEFSAQHSTHVVGRLYSCSEIPCFAHVWNGGPQPCSNSGSKCAPSARPRSP